MIYILRIIIYIILTIVFIFAFAPKKEILLLGEQILSVYKVNIVKQPDNTKIYYDDTYVAKVKIIDISFKKRFLKDSFDFDKLVCGECLINERE